MKLIHLGRLAYIAQAQGDEARTAALYNESLGFWSQSNELGAVEILTGLARLAVKGRPESSVRLFAAGEAVQRRVGLTPAPALRFKNERARTLSVVLVSSPHASPSP